MNIKININFDKLSENYLFSEINKRINKYLEKNKDAKIIRLGIGDVTLPLGKSVIDALVKASYEMANKDTFRGYPPEYGYEFMKDAISKYYKRFNVDIDNDSIFVSDGAKSDLGNIVDIFGDNKIYIPNPVYPVYMDSNIIAGRSINYIIGNEGNDFLPLPNSNIDKNSIIYLCSPNNPTGGVYTYKDLKKWVDFALKNDCLIIFDSAYEAFINSNKYPHSIYEIDNAKACAIEVCSFSKQAGFTGLRCGFTIIPTNLSSNGYLINKLWRRRQATKFNGVSYPVQRAAEAVLSNEGINESLNNIKYYMENAKMLIELFKEKNIYFTGGEESPYIWFKCPNNMKSWEFFDYLLENANVVGTPGAGFGDAGEGYFRITSFNTHENTKEAIDRLRKLL